MEPVIQGGTTDQRAGAGRPTGVRRWAGTAISVLLGSAVLGTALVAFLRPDGSGGVVSPAPLATQPAAAAGPTPLDATAREGTAGAVAALYALVDGQPMRVNNGGSVATADLDVSVLLSPYPPRSQTDVEFTVMRNGQPVDDANVSLSFDMEAMNHGPFRLLAIPLGAGAYIAPLTFNMSGDFWLNVAIDVAGRESVLNLGMVVNR